MKCSKIYSNKLLLFLVIIFLVGFISGFIYYFHINKYNQFIIIDSISSDISTIKIYNVIIHLILVVLIIFLSFFIIGLPLSYFWLFYEGISVSFSFLLLFMRFKLKGLLYGVIYVFLSKCIYLLLLFLLIYNLHGFTYCILIYLKKRNNDYIKRFVIKIKNLFYIVLLIFINDILLYFLGSIILSKFNFLLK